MALNIGNKVYRNLQEQVGYNSEQIDKIFSILDGIDYEDHVVVIEDISTPLNEDELAIVNEAVAFLVYQDRLYFKDSADAQYIYFSAVVEIAGSDVVTLSTPQISVDKTSGALAVIANSVNVYSSDKTDEEINNAKSELNEDISELRTEIQSVASGSPKGVFSTLSDLETAFPTGTEGIYLVLADGHWYYWDGAQWSDGGVYLTTAPDTAFDEESNNSLSNAEIMKGFALIQNRGNKGNFIFESGSLSLIDGSLDNSGSYKTIRIRTVTFINTDFVDYIGALSGYRYFIFYYDESKTFIKSVNIDGSYDAYLEKQYPYFKIVLFNVSTSTPITEDEGNKFVIYYKNASKEASLYSALKGLNIYYPTFINIDLNTSTGAYMYGTNYTKRLCTQIFLTSDFEEVFIKANYRGFIFYYNNDYTLNSFVAMNAGSYTIDKSKTYFIFCLLRTDLGVIAQSEGDNCYFIVKSKNVVDPIIVDANGDGDYTSIIDAVNNAVDGQEIIVRTGLYIIPNGQTINATNKNLIIRGLDRYQCIIRSYDGRYAYPPLHMTHGHLENLTIEARYLNGTSHEGDGTEEGGDRILAYAIHSENDDGVNKTFEIINCTLRSDFASALAVGSRVGNQLFVSNCEMINGETNEHHGHYSGQLGAYSTHENISSDYTGGSYETFKDCVFRSLMGSNTMSIWVAGLSLASYLELTFINCTVYDETLGFNTTIWDRNTSIFTPTSAIKLTGISHGNSNNMLNN